MSSFMMGNNNQQWYLYQFFIKTQKSAESVNTFLRQNLRPGEGFVWTYDKSTQTYTFYIHTTCNNLFIPGVHNMQYLPSHPVSNTFNKAQQQKGALTFIKQAPMINPMNKQNHNQNMFNNNAKMMMMQNNMINNQNMMNMNMINKNAMNMNQMMMMNNQNMINNNAMNINPMMMKGNNFINQNNQNNIINKNWGFNNKNPMMQGFNNKFGNPQLNNDSINQQQQALKALDPKNCETRHIKQFFNEETILKKIKDCQTKYPVNNNVIQTYLNWFSDYICRMYKLINVGTLGKYKKEQPWQEMLSRKNERIKFNINNNTLQSDLMDLIKQDFLNGRNHLLDGHDLINDINQTMNLLAQCSLKVYNREINEKGIYRIVAVYEQLCSCLAANPKAFLDRGILGFGSDRDNALRNVVNDNVKVANLKDLIAGAIKILPV